jgi:SpoVK/Ycf46/Vps4 family AAA+-type ATPase
MAEEDKRALVRISCGDLGQHPFEVEIKLQALLKLALRGSAIVLIDEADTFLARRASSGGGIRDYYHNAIVSIFLKHLEYFPGAIFLTTNQESEIDEAVSSRVIRLRYGPLNVKSRANIWKNNLSKGEQISAEQTFESMCEELGNRYELDGREIKTLANLSLTICRRRKQEVSKEIIQQLYDLTHGTRKISP